MINILHGDCLKELPKLKTESVDLVLADLPFGTSNKCKWDIVIPFDKLWSELDRVCKPSAALLFFGTEPFASHLRLSNLKDYRYDLIWQKERLTNIFFVKKQFGKVHENISVFYKQQPTYNPIMEKRKFNTVGVGDLKESKTHKNQKYKYSQGYDKTKTYPTSVLKFNRDTLKGSLHPTQKPVLLLEYLIKTFSNEGDLILDPTAGSGSTAIACINTNRNFIGFERDKEYFDIASERVQKHQLK